VVEGCLLGLLDSLGLDDFCAAIGLSDIEGLVETDGIYDGWGEGWVESDGIDDGCKEGCVVGESETDGARDALMLGISV